MNDAARSRADVVSLLTRSGIIAVVRAPSASQIPFVCKALIQGGVIAIEITLTTQGAIPAIAEARREFGADSTIGVGTVLDTASCGAALEAGAEFAVSPIGRAELVPMAHSAGRPIMLGAYTPTEAQAVHEAGADFVKLFPADAIGPDYCKALLAPLPHLRLVPTGGVNVRNVAAFLRAGCVAVGVGSALVSTELMQSGKWQDLTSRARAFVEAAASAGKR